MKVQWSPQTTYLICAVYLIITVNIQNATSFLFRRKNIHHVVNDPFQVRQDNITLDNLFGWLNKKNHIKFKLWTRKNPKLAHEIRVGDMESLRTSNFDSRRLTKVIVHGYAHSANEIYLEDWIVSLRDAYLYLADLNILVIDYTLFALPKLYKTAAPELAANRLTDMIRFLLESGQLTLEGLHLLGFSWGAHIAGIAGWKLGGGVGRITGLDPAQPTFRLVENSRRLDKSDALFVDIIHTNGGRAFAEGHLGLGVPLGHVDYYPNSGRAQPGCPLKWTYVYEEIECDHSRSVNFFAESIVSPIGFPACRCDNWDNYVKGECTCGPEDMVSMGEHSPHSTRGKYYLFTRDKKPFGLGTPLNIKLPDINQYDPDWNNTGYHQHLLAFMKREEGHHSHKAPVQNSHNELRLDSHSEREFYQQFRENNQTEPNNAFGKNQEMFVIKAKPIHEAVHIEDDGSWEGGNNPGGYIYPFNTYIENGGGNLNPMDLGKSRREVHVGVTSPTHDISIINVPDSINAANDFSSGSFTKKLFYKYVDPSRRTSKINIVL